MILLNNHFQACKFSIAIHLSVKKVGPACSILVYLNFKLSHKYIPDGKICTY